MKRELDIIQITIMRKKNEADKIIIQFRGDSPYPSWLPDGVPTMSMIVEEGCGKKYVESNFNITPNVLYFK